jgi:hypothetical protein
MRFVYILFNKDVIVLVSVARHGPRAQSACPSCEQMASPSCEQMASLSCEQTASPCTDLQGHSFCLQFETPSIYLILNT